MRTTFDAAGFVERGLLTPETRVSGATRGDGGARSMGVLLNAVPGGAGGGGTYSGGCCLFRKSRISGEGGRQLDLCGMGLGENTDLQLYEIDFLLLGGNLLFEVGDFLLLGSVVLRDALL
jgi:hypothetical protein